MMINLIMAAVYTVTISVLSAYMFDQAVTMVDNSYLFIGWVIMNELIDLNRHRK